MPVIGCPRVGDCVVCWDMREVPKKTMKGREGVNLPHLHLHDVLNSMGVPLCAGTQLEADHRFFMLQVLFL